MSYTNTGVLFNNSYKKGSQPDLKGNLKLERSLLRQLMDEQGDEITINISAWKKQGRNGEFISLSYDAYKKTEEPKQEKKQEVKKPAVDEDEIPF